MATTIPGTAQFPLAIPDLDSLIRSANADTTTTLNMGGGLADDGLSITLQNAVAYPASGTLRIESEILYYNDIAGNVLTVPSTTQRGAEGTTAVAHPNGATVRLIETARSHAVQNDEIIAIALKVGTGADTPTSGDIFQGTGAGSSGWAPITLSSGAGLTGGGSIATGLTLDVGAGSGITVNANDVAWAPETYTNNITLWTGASASRTLTANLSGTDPVITFSSAAISVGSSSFTQSIGGADPFLTTPSNATYNLPNTQTVQFGTAATIAVSTASHDYRLISGWINNTGTTNVVAGSFGARADAAGQAWGINPWGYANFSGATGIGIEGNFGVLTSGGAAYGEVFVVVGNFNSTAFVQWQSGASGISAAHGLIVNRGAVGLEPIAGAIITTAGTPSMTAGIDLSGGIFSGNAFASPSFAVNGSGQITAVKAIFTEGTGSAITFSGTPAFGVDFLGTTYDTAPMRLPNNSPIMARNAANSANLILLTLDSGNTTTIQSGGGATFGFRVLNAGNTANLFTITDGGHVNVPTSGFTVGAPTGGDKGGGSINVAADIYKNNLAYTNPDYALEYWAHGSIERFKNNVGAVGYKRLAIEEAEAFIREHLYLPGISREASGLFERADFVLEKVEELFTYVIDLNHRLKTLEDRREDDHHRGSIAGA